MSNPATRRLFSAAALFTLLAVAMGSVVCATQSGFECGHWPGCDANALLPNGPLTAALFKNPWIEMVHRTSAILAGPTALIAAVVAARRRDAGALVKVLPWVAVAGAIVAGYVGRGVVIGQRFPAWVSAADLGSALAAMMATLVAAVAVRRAAPGTPAVWAPSRQARLAWSAVGVLLVMHLVSLYAAGPGSYTRCMSWPVWGLLSADAAGSLPLQYARFALAGLAALLIVAAFAAGPRARAAQASVALLVIVAALGAFIRVTGTDDLGAPYSVATVALLWTLTLLAARGSLLRSHTRTIPSVDAVATSRP